MRGGEVSIRLEGPPLAEPRTAYTRRRGFDIRDWRGRRRGKASEAKEGTAGVQARAQTLGLTSSLSWVGNSTEVQYGTIQYSR